MRAMLWEKSDSFIQCLACSHGCKLAEGKTGKCGVRVNHHGQLIGVAADIATALSMDPVEKKPLYHFLPGTRTFSIGSAGCNFHCAFCQNSDISQVTPRSAVSGRHLTPETIARLAAQNRAPSISYTYNEPTVFLELAYETAGLAREADIRNIIVSNGFMSHQWLKSMSKRIDAANIDLKSFSDDFYRKLCGARLQPVLDNLKHIRDLGWWLEVTTLVIPGINDSAEELGKIASFIKTELGPETPWHISGFHGAYRMADYPATPREKLEEALAIGQDEGLSFVYLGNTASRQGANTSCPHCGTLLITRDGYRIRKRISNGICPSCGNEIPGIWE